VDYFFIKKGNIHTPSLFNPSPGSLYYGTKGWNLKALLAWVSAAILGVPGLIGAYHPSWVSAGAKDLYKTGWVVCFAVAVGVYCGLCVAFPRRVRPADPGNDTAMPFEKLVETEGYLPGEQAVGYQLRILEGLAGRRSSSSGVESSREATKLDV
jgi:NCS1 family nucleobase:cation symporter-1